MYRDKIKTVSESPEGAFGESRSANQIAVTAHSDPVLLGYAGYSLDAESGLYCTGARCYDPQLGRWTSTDPIFPTSGLNPYTYVGNNPAVNVDPSGELAKGTSYFVCGLAKAVCAEAGFSYTCSYDPNQDSAAELDCEQGKDPNKTAQNSCPNNS